MRKIIFTLFSFISMSFLAQNKKRENPFGLVYDGAIIENIQGKVNIRAVRYKVNNIDIAANVYLPADFNENRKYPALVVAHPNGGVKEQVAGLYAQLLAEKGFITIAFDAAYQGASGGFPRYIDKPFYRIEDIRGAADFLIKYKGVDIDKLGLLGICGGGGYAIKVAQTDKRFKAVATLSMFNSGDVRRNGFMRSQMDTIQERINKATKAREKEASTGEVTYSESFALGMTEEQISKLPFDLYREGVYYYGKDYFHPNSQTNYTLSSLLDLIEFDVNTNVDLINQPLLMIAGENADSLYMTEEVFANATGTKNKELFKIHNATHIQTYWKPEYVQQISEKLDEFFCKYLKNRLK